MADVVAGSGASVGSIYHHFGGKSELFLAIFEQMADAVDSRIDAAMRHAGDSRPDGRRVFELHVRAYLEAMWENRRLARVLTSGDTPAGFEVARRNRMQAAFRSWMAVLELDTVAAGTAAQPGSDGDHGGVVADGRGLREPRRGAGDHRRDDRMDRPAHGVADRYARSAVMCISTVPWHGPLKISVCMTPASVPSAWGV